MIEQLKELITQLEIKRDGVMEQYITALQGYDVINGSVPAADWAARIHDLDRHITNINMEWRRLEALEKMQEIPHV